MVHTLGPNRAGSSRSIRRPQPTRHAQRAAYATDAPSNRRIILACRIRVPGARICEAGSSQLPAEGGCPATLHRPCSNPRTHAFTVFRCTTTVGESHWPSEASMRLGCAAKAMTPTSSRPLDRLTAGGLQGDLVGLGTRAAGTGHALRRGADRALKASELHLGLWVERLQRVQQEDRLGRVGCHAHGAANERGHWHT